MQVLQNFSIPGSREKPILLDAFFNPDGEKKPVVIFAHGFKGFKDWGHFNVLGKRFVEEGFIFIKFNFSHNGTTHENPEVFSDLEAFGNNNYLIELDDLGLVIDWALSSSVLSREIDAERLFLLGHSRGGGIIILKAAEDLRVKKIVTWASVCDFLNRNKKKTIETWKKEGVVYSVNMRTQQKMPLYYQFYETMVEHKERLNVLQSMKGLRIPALIIHGTNDEAVPINEAEQLRRVAHSAELLVVEGAGHTFDVKHPFAEGPLPGNAELVVFKTMEFFRN